MQQSYTETIAATPEAIAPWLMPDRWPVWYAADGPLPRLESVSREGDNFVMVSGDGQRAIVSVETSDRVVITRLQSIDAAVWDIQQTNTMRLTPTGENETDLTWECNWQRDTTGWPDLLIDWLINGSVGEMMDLSLWNLKTIAEEKPDDNGINPDTDPDY